jgi:hypothetical protein
MPVKEQHYTAYGALHIQQNIELLKGVDELIG